MIFRLFFIPFFIVAVLVGVYILGQTLFGKVGRSRSAEQFLHNLDSTNPDIRWRAASDLSQELPRSAELAANASFALELVERLVTALDESAIPEKDFAVRHAGLTPAEKEKILNKDLAPRRHLIMYLGACLGNFIVPVGVPLLKSLSAESSTMEPDALAERRGRALFALAVLGENLKRYDALTDSEKDRIDEELTAALQKEGQASWARACLDYLQQRRAGKATSFGVAEALARCAEDEDPYLRELTALASNFWTGSATEQTLIETFLRRLSMDTGHGHERLEERQARNPDARRSRAISKKNGYQVQVNANLALARRGSPHVRFDLLEEMLDPAYLREIFVVRQMKRDREASSEQPDEALVVITVSGSLKALKELRRLRPEMKLDRLKEKVTALTSENNPALRTEAETTLQALNEPRTK
jgi:hypothetical protein